MVHSIAVLFLASGLKKKELHTSTYVLEEVVGDTEIENCFE